jgi:hypothetical protein
MTAARKKNTLNRLQTRQLEDWLVAHREDLESGKMGARHEIAAAAQRELKFMITDGNVTGSGDVMGIKWPPRAKMSSPIRTGRRWKIITQELNALMKTLGHVPSPAFQALVEEAETIEEVA